MNITPNVNMAYMALNNLVPGYSLITHNSSAYPLSQTYQTTYNSIDNESVLLPPTLYLPYASFSFSINLRKIEKLIYQC